MENIFTMDKKGINHLNVPNGKEWLIKELKARKELHMLMKMLDHHILKMLKEDKSKLIEVSYWVVRMNLIKEGACFTQGENVKISFAMWSLMVEVLKI